MEKLPTAKTKPKFDFDLKKDSITLLMMVVTAIIQGLVISAFYSPYTLLPSGLTGVGLLLNYIFGTDKALMILLLNIPVVLIGLFNLDLKTILFSTVGTILLAFTVEITPAWVEPFLPALKMQPLLAAAFGSVLLGLSYAPVLRRGATFGGMDIIALILYEKLSINMGSFSTAYNVLIFAALGIATKNIELGVLSLVALFICTTSYDIALQNMRKTDTVFIISDKWEEIAKELLNDAHKGITYIPAVGAYTNAPRKIVYCVVKPTEVPKLRRTVFKYDRHAMFSVIETKQVNGGHFKGIG